MTFLLVELALKRSNGWVLLAIAAMGVEDLQERRENRVLAVGATRGIRLLPNVEENAPRGRARRTLDQSLQNREVLVVLAMLQKDLRRTPSADIAVLQHGGKDLEEVGLTGTEEARDPRAVGISVVVVLEERLEVGADLVRDDELLQFILENVVVLGLDDAVDMPIDVLLENALDGHVCVPLDRCVDGVVHLEKSLDIEGTIVSPALLPTEQVK